MVSEVWGVACEYRGVRNMRHATLLYAALAAKLRCDGFSPVVSRPPLPRPRAASGGAWRRAAVPDRRGSDGRRTVCPARRGDDDAGDARPERRRARKRRAAGRRGPRANGAENGVCVRGARLVFLGAEAATSADGDRSAPADFARPRTSIRRRSTRRRRGRTPGPARRGVFAAVYVVAEVLAPAVQLHGRGLPLRRGRGHGDCALLGDDHGGRQLPHRPVAAAVVGGSGAAVGAVQAIDRAVASEAKIILLLRLSPIFALSGGHGLTAVGLGRALPGGSRPRRGPSSTSTRARSRPWPPAPPARRRGRVRFGFLSVGAAWLQRCGSGRGPSRWAASSPTATIDPAGPERAFLRRAARITGLDKADANSTW